MKSGNKDKAEGTAKNIKGQIKEKAGKATDNRKLEAKGDRDQAEGKIQKSRGDLKKAAGK